MMQGKHLALVAGAGAAIVVLGVALVAVSWSNEAASLEISIQAQRKDNQSRYDALWKKVRETVQVADKYQEDFRAVILDALQAEAKPDAAMSFLQRTQPGLDPAVYARVQDTIVAGRDDFARGQTDLLDRQRRYQVHLRTFPGSAWASLLGYPKPLVGPEAPPRDVDGDGRATVLDYEPLLSSHTRGVFQQGAEDAPMKVFERE